jgi:apolipoprotein N-acyltransferase
VIWPLICYESIFPYEVRVSNKSTDVIINITNDAWYGNSSGPYQHFEISRMRAIENGLPLLRTANNGITAFIDPLGRVLAKTKLNDITILDNFIPKKLPYETPFSKYKPWILLLWVYFVLILQLIIKFCIYILPK